MAVGLNSISNAVRNALMRDLGQKYFEVEFLNGLKALYEWTMSLYP